MKITRKFYGDDSLIERCIVSLIGNRGLILVGEPGTAKSMLSELFSAAISGDSTNTIQGTAGTTEDQIKYSWNYALLLTEGPSTKSLIPAPVYKGMKSGKLVRFEEITRCQPEIQDVLVSMLSEKIMHIPELEGDDGILCAEKGFNILATANIRDRGVNDMSSALKRRFNFETVKPIKDKALEMKLVKEQSEAALKEMDIDIKIPVDVLDVLVTTFYDLREGQSMEGITIDKPSTIMSTSEAVSVGISSGIDAFYFGKKEPDGINIARQITGTVFKDDPEDIKKFSQYFNTVVKMRSKNSKAWKIFYEARNLIER
jgi:MoxR-like ATPase